MNRADIICELTKRGYVAEKKDVTKNGVIFEGIMFGNPDSQICPIVYTQAFIEEAKEKNFGIEEVVDNIFLHIKGNDYLSDAVLEQIMDKSFCARNIRIGIQKVSESDVDYVKKETEFEGLEQYLYVNGGPNSDFSYKVSEKYLHVIGLSEDLSWKIAEENTFSATRIISLSNFLNQFIEAVEGIHLDSLDSPLYIITNDEGIKGAGAILNKEAIANFFNDDVDSVYVLPSSIHEMLLIPVRDDAFTLDDLSKMVSDNNLSQVKPEERLINRAYIMKIR